MTMSKATMIRRVAREGGFGNSNKEIADEIDKRFGAKVGANQIIEVLGPYAKRQQDCPIFGRQLDLAKRFLKAIGDKNQAVRLLGLANQQHKKADSERHPECRTLSNLASAYGGD